MMWLVCIVDLDLYYSDVLFLLTLTFSHIYCRVLYYNLVFSFVNKENFIFEKLYIAWIFQNSHTVTTLQRVDELDKSDGLGLCQGPSILLGSFCPHLGSRGLRSGRLSNVYNSLGLWVLYIRRTWFSPLAFPSFKIYRGSKVWNLAGIFQPKSPSSRHRFETEQFIWKRRWWWPTFFLPNLIAFDAHTSEICPKGGAS